MKVPTFKKAVDDLFYMGSPEAEFSREAFVVNPHELLEIVLHATIPIRGLGVARAIRPWQALIRQNGRLSSQVERLRSKAFTFYRSRSTFREKSHPLPADPQSRTPSTLRRIGGVRFAPVCLSARSRTRLQNRTPTPAAHSACVIFLLAFPVALISGFTAVELSLVDVGSWMGQPGEHHGLPAGGRRVGARHEGEASPAGAFSESAVALLRQEEFGFELLETFVDLTFGLLDLGGQVLALYRAGFSVLPGAPS